jgi:hypothetical protein
MTMSGIVKRAATLSAAVFAMVVAGRAADAHTAPGPAGQAVGDLGLEPGAEHRVPRTRTRPGTWRSRVLAAAFANQILVIDDP